MRILPVCMCIRIARSRQGKDPNHCQMKKKTSAERRRGRLPLLPLNLRKNETGGRQCKVRILGSLAGLGCVTFFGTFLQA